MIASARPCTRSSHAKCELESAFAALLPRIELHGHIYFRHLDPDQKADAVQEMRSLGWKWLLSLHQAGKDPADFIMSFTTFLARSVNSGRRLAGMMKSTDAMNPLTQKRYAFKVEPLPSVTRTGYDDLYASPQGQELHDAFEERLCDNTITPVPDQVCFRIDFPAWLATVSPRNRQIAEDMALGYTTWELAQKYGVSPSRISQLRREIHEDWARFCGELLEEEEQPLLAVA